MDLDADTQFTSGEGMVATPTKNVTSGSAVDVTSVQPQTSVVVANFNTAIGSITKMVSGLATEVPKGATDTDTVKNINSTSNNVKTSTSNVDLGGVETRLDTIIENMNNCTKVAYIQPDNLVSNYNGYLDDIDTKLDDVVENTKPNFIDYTGFLVQ